MTTRRRDNEILSRGQTRLLLWAIVIGALAGGAAVLFRSLSIYMPRLIWGADADLVRAVAGSATWMRLIVPVVGSLLAGLVLMLGARFSGPEQGWDILEAVVLRDGVLHLRPALVKGLSSLLTIASAGAIGREGPMVLFSATVSSLFGRSFSVPTRYLRILVGCGVAAGIACAYNTPIGAALFTMEIIVGNFALEVFAPLVFASVIATIISRAAFGSLPIFTIPEFGIAGGWELIPFTLLGVLGGMTAALFLQALRTSSSLFRRSRLPRPIAMAAVGLALGIVILRFPDVVGNGRESILHLFAQEWSISLALTLLILRLTLTSATVGSGAVGGVFTPTLFIGAVLGEAFGSVIHHFSPGLISPPKAYAVAGMGALLAGTTHAPITAVVMLFEMTMDYNMVLPLMLAAAAASLVARQLNQDSVYTEALKRKRSAGTAEEAVMRKLTVRDVMRSDQITVHADLPLPQVLDRIIAARRNHVYVTDKNGEFLGVLGLHDVNRELRESDNPPELKAGDLANLRFQTTTPDEHLDRVLERFWSEEAERLPVLESRDSGRLVGTISQRDILGIYSLEVLHRRSLLARFEQGDSPDLGPTYVELPADHEVDDVPVPIRAVGRTLAESRFREVYGVTVLMLRRPGDGGKDVRLIPEGGTVFQPGDHLVVVGSREKIRALREANLSPRG